MLLHGGRVLSCGFYGWCNVGCDAFGGRLSRPFRLTCGDFRKWNKRRKFPVGVGFELERVKDAELIHAIVLLWQIGSMNGNSETPLALKAAVMKNFHLFKKKQDFHCVCNLCSTWKQGSRDKYNCGIHPAKQFHGKRSAQTQRAQHVCRLERRRQHKETQETNRSAAMCQKSPSSLCPLLPL